MILIAGLGNPGLRYHNTRHNIGFKIIDSLAGYFEIGDFNRTELYITGSVSFKDIEVSLMKPLTYMNLSGRAVKDFSDRFEIPKENILIVYDDVNLDFGTLRMRPSGSDGGQNGIKSVIYEFESEEIPRLRVGIRHRDELDKVKDESGAYDLAEYVLDEFSDYEEKNMDKVVTAAREAVLSFILNGVNETMNVFNRNFLEEDKKT